LRGGTRLRLVAFNQVGERTSESKPVIDRASFELYSLLFIVQNYKVVEIRFLFWTLSMSRVLLLFGVFVVGTVVGWLLKSFSSR
jgi:uncharacterized integral membrane protein